MRIQLTIQELMVLGLLAGLWMASFLLHPSLGSFLFGVFSLAFHRTYGAIHREQQGCFPMLTSKKVHTFCGSAAVATLILLISLIPSLCLLPFYTLVPLHSYPEFGIRTILGIIVSAVLSIPIVILLRRWLWKD